MESIKKFIRDEDGLELSEYAVVGGLIILGAVVAIGLLGDQIVNVFTRITAVVTPAA